MTDFKSEMRELTNELLVDYGDECFKHQHRDIINKFSSSLLALIENRLPKEKYVDREENPLKDYGEQIGFNACLSEIKKEMGI
jgi:hypothetical protein